MQEAHKAQKNNPAKEGAQNKQQNTRRSTLSARHARATQEIHRRVQQVTKKSTRSTQGILSNHKHTKKRTEEEHKRTKQQKTTKRQ